MSLEDTLNEDVIITAYSFQFDGLEISFLERDEQKELVSVGKIMSIEIPDYDEELQSYYAQLQAIGRALIERGFTDIRNPPKRIHTDDESR